MPFDISNFAKFVEAVSTGSVSGTGNVVNLGNITGGVVCDLSKGVCFTGTLTGNVTVTFSNWPVSPSLTEPLLIFTQDGTGGRTITIPGIIWVPSTAPVFVTTPAAVTIVPLSSSNQGATLYGAGQTVVAQWSTIQSVLSLGIPGGASTAQFVMGIESGAIAVAAAASASAAFHMDPANYVGSPMLRLRGMLVTNAVAPGINFTYGLYPVATWGGASGAYPTIASLGTVVTSGTITAPGAGGGGVPVVTAPVAFPAAGWYVFVLGLSGTVAAGANTTHSFELTLK